MRLHEIINEKERVDEVLPFIPLAIAGGKAAAAAIAKKALIKGGLVNKIRQWTSKTPPDTSVPDALKTSKVGYGTGQVDPSLATAARQKLAVAGKGVTPKNKFSKAIGPMSNLERKRLR